MNKKEIEKFNVCCLGLLLLCFYMENYLDKKYYTDKLKIGALISLKNELVLKEKTVFSTILDNYFKSLKELSKITEITFSDIHRECLASTAQTQVEMENDLDFELRVRTKFNSLINDIV